MTMTIDKAAITPEALAELLCHPAGLVPVTCGTCEGTGRLPRLDPDRCDFCAGTGAIWVPPADAIEVDWAAVSRANVSEVAMARVNEAVGPDMFSVWGLALQKFLDQAFDPAFQPDRPRIVGARPTGIYSLYLNPGGWVVIEPFSILDGDRLVQAFIEHGGIRVNVVLAIES